MSQKFSPEGTNFSPQSTEQAVKQLINACRLSKPIMAYKAVIRLLDCDLDTAKDIVRDNWESDERNSLSYNKGFYDGVCSVDKPVGEAVKTIIEHSSR